MDNEQIARDVRRRQVTDSLQFEREREQTIKEQVELVIAEVEGKRVDEAAFARMAPEDVEIVGAELNPPSFDSEDDEGFYFERDDVINFDDPVDAQAEELARLNGELEDCRRRQRAFQAYLDALGT